jgi:uncharacterized protein YciI
MRHFILEGKHLAPFEQFAHLEPEHHEFLEKGYDDGAFLFSGPQVPPHGGFLVARAESREQLELLLAEEPFVKGGFMKFTSVTEFDPAQHQPLLKEWFAGAPVDERRNPSHARQASDCHSPGSGAKHFLLQGEHLVPFSELADLVDDHHRFLQKGYDEGHFLFSGPQNPPRGGFLIARAESREALDRLLADEPFVKAGKMRFSRITQFNPAQSTSVLNSWFQKTASQEKRSP